MHTYTRNDVRRAARCKQEAQPNQRAKLASNERAAHKACDELSFVCAPRGGDEDDYYFLPCSGSGVVVAEATWRNSQKIAF